MPDDQWVTVRFEANRPRLRALAYRMLGSRPEADDAVQEAWIRLQRSGVDDVENFGGWLTTVTSRVCLDRLRSRQSRPEDPVDDLEEAEGGHDPADQAVLAESIGAALLIVLDALG